MNDLSIKGLLIIYIFSCFCMVPMALSHGILAIGVFLNISSSALLYVCAKCNGYRADNMNPVYYFMAVVALGIGFVCGGADFKSMGISVCVFTSMFLVFQFEVIKRLFFQWFFRTILVLSICAIVGELLSHIFPKESLLITTLDYSRNRYIYDVYFPLDITTRYWINSSSWLSRHYLFFGEPGIAPAFMFPVLCYFYYNSYKLRITKCCIVLAAMFLTLSTTLSVALFGGMYLCYFFSHRITIKSIIFTLVLGAIGVFAFLYMPYFGYYDKLDSAYGASVTARYDMVDQHMKQIQFVESIIFIAYIYRFKINQPLYLAVNLVIAICSLANIMFMSNLYFIFLFFYDEFNKPCAVGGNVREIASDV